MVQRIRQRSRAPQAAPLPLGGMLSPLAKLHNCILFLQFASKKGRKIWQKEARFCAIRMRDRDF